MCLERQNVFGMIIFIYFSVLGLNPVKASCCRAMFFSRKQNTFNLIYTLSVSLSSILYPSLFLFSGSELLPKVIFWSAALAGSVLHIISDTHLSSDMIAKKYLNLLIKKKKKIFYCNNAFWCYLFLWHCICFVNLTLHICFL